MLIGGSKSDDWDNENELEWLQFISNLYSTVNAPSTVALYACIIDVNKELKYKNLLKMSGLVD